MSDDAERDPDTIAEDEKVYGWRMQVCVEELGLPVPVAEKFARSKADLHRLCDLVASGCDAETAVKILL